MVVEAKALIVIQRKSSIVLTQHENVCVFNDNGVGYVGRPAARPLGSKGGGLGASVLAAFRFVLRFSATTFAKHSNLSFQPSEHESRNRGGRCLLEPFAALEVAHVLSEFLSGPL